MRRTHFFAPTLRETPADAITVSHKLMLRAGLVRMLAAGIYSYLPLGWTAVRKATDIVREEMNAIGGQEFFLPALTPLEIWDETGRNADFGDEMFRLKDRKGQDKCLAPTHEEIICYLARGEVRSWRDLPQIWYQFQTKFRDEPRPRGGMLRLRQFIMKDAYSLDRDEEGLDRAYELHRIAYKRIFTRCGIDFFIVGASSGLMGGSKSQEFMFESEAGEDEAARCDFCGYAANMEVAESRPDPVPQGIHEPLREVSTPNRRTVEEVSQFLGVPAGRMVKTLIYVGPQGPIMALISGEDELSESKLMRLAKGMIRPAQPDEVKDWMGAEVGFLGPHGKHRLPIYADLRLQGVGGMATGANRNDYHVMGLEFERDVKPQAYVDLRVVRAGEQCPVCHKPLRILKAIELGHIFKLGTKYSAAMRAVFLDENSVDQPIVMGSYGIGLERILAAAIEGSADADGIRWNSALSPLDCLIVPIGGEAEVNRVGEELYDSLKNARFAVLIDDREARPGVKMKDADLLGIPAHVVISTRNLDKKVVEVKNRWSGERQYVPLNKVAETIRGVLVECLPKQPE